MQNQSPRWSVPSTLHTGLCTLIGASFLWTSIASGQVRPVLDPKIPPYQYAGAMTGTVTVAGSDTMKPLTESWAADLRQLYPGIAIKVDSTGSETGLSRLLEGKAQIAAMSRRMTAQEIVEFKREFGYEPTEVSVAIDALAIFVHKDNPIEGLTLPELDAVFSKDRRRGLKYTLQTWGDLMLDGEWAEAPIHLYGRSTTSGTTTFFREHVLEGSPIKPAMITCAGAASVVVELMKDRFGIGFSSIGYRTSGVRPVPIAAVPGSHFVEPSVESAMNGSYPLRRPLYLYINKAPKVTAAPLVAEYVKFALSAQGQQTVIAQGYYPLPLPELQRLTAVWAVPARSAALEQPLKLRD